MKKRPHPWADYNGPGKGITVKQMHELLAKWGIEPVKLENGEWGFKREQFETAWAILRARGEMK